ncbi:MAG TPA: glycoside hydrolase family 3 N-terminal domain-containing protein [Spirochaetia bacterium]|nr:glycoside hydrolase family 3 N-terminal domain-containing protein [Spirochaetia bacterium]
MPSDLSGSIRLTGESSIPNVIAQLTLLEKASLCGGATAFRTHGVERLGIPPLVMADGHNGINIFHLLHNYVAEAAARLGVEPRTIDPVAARLRAGGREALGALLSQPQADPSGRALAERLRKELPAAGLPSCFPTGIVMAATWNPDLVFECGRAVAREALAFGMDVVLGPNVNIHRDPLGGRVFESYSEDPFVAARIGVAYIRGMQSEGVAAVVKHFAANNQESERLGVDELISQRALQEIYFPAFKAAVQEAGVWMVMSAYNKVNGVACALNRGLLTDLLRSQWGFAGFVVSDWGAAYDRVAALRAGNDLEMPGPRDPQQIVDAVNRGELSESVLDQRVAAILRVMVKLPAFQFPGRPRPALDRAASASVARRVAAEGMVLLKNDRATLPLPAGRIAVFGENARDPFPTGTGSAGVVAPYCVSFLEGLRTRYGAANVSFDELPQNADLVVLCVGEGSGEGTDRASMRMAAGTTQRVLEVARRSRQAGKRLAVILNVCAPVEIAEWVDRVDAVLLAWMAGMEMGNAAADIVSGDVSPSGKLPLTWPRRHEDTPTFTSFPGEFGESVYGEGIFVGYRYYDSAGVSPQFPFGHGLSYSTFQLSGLTLSSSTVSLEGGTITVSVDIENTGDRRGAEVVQLYIHDARSSVRKPEQELKAFAKAELDPHQKRTVSFSLTADALAHYDTRKARWCVEPGSFEVRVGTSSRNTPLRAEFRAVGPNPYGYGLSTAIGTLMADQRSRAVLERNLPPGTIQDQAVLDFVKYAPFVPLGQALSIRLADRLRELSAEERERMRDRIVDELSKIEVE